MKFCIAQGAAGTVIDLSDLEQLLLVAPARRLGRAVHVELPPRLGNVGEDGPKRLFSTVAAWLTCGRLSKVRYDVVPDRQPPVGIMTHHGPLAR